MTKKDKVYIASFYKFGYDLTVVGHTEKEAIDSLMAEYVETYKKWNGGSDPREDEIFYRGCSYYDNAKEDIVVNELEFGKVEWL